MLIKYLNDLDRAVQRTAQSPTLEQIGRCAECVAVLQEYLASQMEPIQRRGFEIMQRLLPADYERWVMEWASATLRDSAVVMGRGLSATSGQVANG